MQFIKNIILLSIQMGALFILCPKVVGQDNTKTDTNKHYNEIIKIDDDIAIDTAKRKHEHSPRIATLSSALLPGLGQAYNQKYWKMPLIWGGGIALYTYFDFNNSYYHRFKLANEQIKNDIPVTDPDLQELSGDAISQNKDYYRQQRDRAVIFMGLLYVANIVDAMVDAHLLSYDISEDLSLHWQPTIISPYNNNKLASTVGVNIWMKF